MVVGGVESAVERSLESMSHSETVSEDDKSNPTRFARSCLTLVETRQDRNGPANHESPSFFPDSNVDTSFAPDAHLARHCALGRCRPSHSLALKRASPNRSSLFSNVAILLARFVSTWKVCQRHASMTFATDTILSTASFSWNRSLTLFTKNIVGVSRRSGSNRCSSINRTSPDQSVPLFVFRDRP